MIKALKKLFIKKPFTQNNVVWLLNTPYINY